MIQKPFLRWTVTRTGRTWSASPTWPGWANASPKCGFRSHPRFSYFSKKFPFFCTNSINFFRRTRARGRRSTTGTDRAGSCPEAETPADRHPEALSRFVLESAAPLHSVPPHAPTAEPKVRWTLVAAEDAAEAPEASCRRTPAAWGWCPDTAQLCRCSAGEERHHHPSHSLEWVWIGSGLICNSNIVLPNFPDRYVPPWFPRDFPVTNLQIVNYSDLQIA